jgi:hypothetical protein
MTQAELDDLLRRIRPPAPEPEQVRLDREEAARQLREALNRGEVILGPGLKLMLPDDPRP